MELKVSSSRQDLSPSDCDNDPDENRISDDDDDDDRNHKHRRRDARSQSLERDALEQVSTRPFRKRKKPFENGSLFRESDYQSSAAWKSLHNAPTEKDLSMKFEKRPFRSNLDINQRIRVNHVFSADPSPGSGRSKDLVTWNQRDPRFNSCNISSQMVHQGSVPSSLFTGWGRPDVSNAQSASWGTFGLLPGMPNGGMDTLHPLDLQGTLRPPINHLLNIGLPRQRCRDFEEQGFCLRGDMCPMEHGVNRIVIEDVQSLSQFNLPVSVPNAHLMGTAAGPGTLPSVSTFSGASKNSKGIRIKSSKPGVAEDVLSSNGTFSGSVGAGEADLYDPDQPLWNSDCPETSTGLLTVPSPKIDVTESPLDADLSDHHRGGFSEGANNEQSVTGNAAVWGRIGASRNRIGSQKKLNSAMSSLNIPENDTVDNQESFSIVQGIAREGKQIITEGIGSKAIDFSSKMLTNARWKIRKPSQKAVRTLFVSGIPPANNKREALLSHFRKFGDVLDIHIPLNSDRAFVQFSKMEEAEDALMAPDAVMGNRFIKLFWANRDSIPDNSITSGNGAPVTSCGVATASAPSHPFVANSIQPAAPKVSIVRASEESVPFSDHPKPVGTNGPKTPPPLHKKIETLELLKDELRKKQEMLDQKRNDFRRQLNKLEKVTGLKSEVAAEQGAKKQKVGSVANSSKDTAPTATKSRTTIASEQAETGLKSEVAAEQGAKKQKVGSVANSSKDTTPTPTISRTTIPSELAETGLKSEVAAEQGAKKQKVGSVANSSKDTAPTPTKSRTTIASEQAETIEKNKPGEPVVPQSPKPGPSMALQVLQEPANLTQQLQPLASVGLPFPTSRFKLDNRPTTFRIIPPLPTGFSNVPVLKEHFASYGDLSMVELEDSEANEGGDDLDISDKISARITFATRRSAEWAFVNGKCWQDHNLKFMWLTSSNAKNHQIGSDKSPTAPDVLSNAATQTLGNIECIVTKEAANSATGESESSERGESSVGQTEQDEVPCSSLTLEACEKV